MSTPGPPAYRHLGLAGQGSRTAVDVVAPCCNRRMLENPEEIDRLQQLLDRSAASAGPHLRGIITDERRLSAVRVTERLQGMRLLVVATMTADGRPLTGPVDGYFLHGSFYFGSGRNSVRMRLDFAAAVREVLEVMTAGLLARSSALGRPERRFVGLDPGAGALDAFGEGVYAERGALGKRQPVDGQAAGDVVDRGPHPGDLRVVGMPVGHEELVKPVADKVGEWHLVLQPQGQGNGIGADQAGRAGAMLAPVDEDLAEAAVGALVGGEAEPFGANADSGGVSNATPGHLPTNANHHGLASELVYETPRHGATTQSHGSPLSLPAGHRRRPGGVPGPLASATVADVDHVLTTERLVLRPVTAHDHAVLMAHWILPDVRRYLFDGEALSPAEVAETIEDSVQDFAAGGYGIWIIQEEHGTALVGTTGLRPLDDLGLEIFYSLTPGSWGKGYATEAARAVVEHALGPLGLPEVLAEVDEGNAASIAVVRRLGMTPIAVVPGVLGPMTRYRRTAETT